MSPEHLTSYLMNGFLRDLSTFHQKLIKMCYKTFWFWQMNLPGKRLFQLNIPASVALAILSNQFRQLDFCFVCLYGRWQYTKEEGSVLPSGRAHWRWLTASFLLSVSFTRLFFCSCAIFTRELSTCRGGPLFLFTSLLCFLSLFTYNSTGKQIAVSRRKSPEWGLWKQGALTANKCKHVL